jgi:hypothetical protein
MVSSKNESDVSECVCVRILWSRMERRRWTQKDRIAYLENNKLKRKIMEENVK